MKPKGKVAEGPFKENVLDCSESEIYLKTPKPKEPMHIPGYKELDYEHDTIDKILKEVLKEQVKISDPRPTERSFRSLPERSTLSRMA